MQPKVGELIQFIKSDGTIFDLNSPPSRGIFNMTGWGKPPDERHTISGPYQHGDTMVSYRLRPRTIALDILHPYLSRSEWHVGRSNLLDQMGLNNASPNSPVTGVLRWEYFEGTVHQIRCLDVYLSQGLGFTPLEGWRQWTVAESVEFIALNPVIYDPTPRSVTINAWVLGVVYPVTFPIVLGSHGATATVTYTGTWETIPVIVITGPAAGVYIENLTTDKFIRLDYSIGASETVTITMEQNNVSVVSSLGDDLLQYVSDDSDLNEFTFQTANIVTDGDNVLVAYTTNIDLATQVKFNYLNRYYGI